MLKANTVPAAEGVGTLKAGEMVKGWVETVDQHGMWVTISPTVRGQITSMDASDDAAVVRDLREHFKEGQLLKSCRVVAADGKRNRLDLTLLKASSILPRVGVIRAATIVKISPKIGMNIKAYLVIANKRKRKREGDRD